MQLQEKHKNYLLSGKNFNLFQKLKNLRLRQQNMKAHNK